MNNQVKRVAMLGVVTLTFVNLVTWWRLRTLDIVEVYEPNRFTSVNLATWWRQGTLDIVEVYEPNRFKPAPEYDASALAEFKFKFPTVEERVEYYMGGWTKERAATVDADAMCRAMNRYKKTRSESDKLEKAFLYDVNDIRTATCFRDERAGCGWESETLEVMTSVSPPLRAVYLYWGDANGNEYNHFPLVTKSGLPRTPQNLLNPGPNGIIWPTQMFLAFRALDQYDALVADGNVTAWEDKKETVLWRGRPTGNGIRGFKHFDKAARVRRHRVPNSTLGQRPYVAKKFFDYDTADIDIALTDFLDRLDGPGFKSLTRPGMSMEEQLKYKYLVSMEGHDVATNLKWMLYSNSVVFSSAPTVVSYPMEDLLVPWVHYIPVAFDYHDLPEKLAWARAHDDEARKISEQAMEYMVNLWASEKAQQDHSEIVKQLGQRYRDLFEDIVSKCVEKKGRWLG